MPSGPRRRIWTPEEDDENAVIDLTGTIGLFSAHYSINSGTSKRVTVFIYPTDNINVFIKLEKIAGDYVILNTGEWSEM